MKIKYLFIGILFLTILSLSFISSAHYIVGAVYNATDGTNANNRTVTLWNTTNPNSNMTDKIGIYGESVTNNTYMFDCEVIGCNVGYNLSIQVLESGGYKTNLTTLLVTGLGFDLASDLTLFKVPIIPPVNTTTIAKFGYNYLTNYESKIQTMNLTKKQTFAYGGKRLKLRWK